jgi:hypothetical protein
MAAFASLLTDQQPHNSIVVSSEFPQGDERFLVSHLGQRVSTPKAYFLGCVTEILTEDAMSFRAMIMREGFRRPFSDLGMFSLISDDHL